MPQIVQQLARILRIHSVWNVDPRSKEVAMLLDQDNTTQIMDFHQEKQAKVSEQRGVRLEEWRSLLRLSLAQDNISMAVILSMVHLSVSDLQLEREKGVQENRFPVLVNTMMRERRVLEKMHRKFRWNLDLRVLILVARLHSKYQVQVNITLIFLLLDTSHLLLEWALAKEMAN